MSAESQLTHVIIALMMIIAVARLGGIAFKAVGQPVVCGEIAAGLVLGPSVFGAVFPGVSADVFTTQANEILSMLSQLGLILFLFLIGIDVEFRHLRAHLGKPVVISAVGISIPFAMGLGAGLLIHHAVAPGVSSLTFALFVATALSITALPVLGRIMVEFGLNKTPLGVLTITAAAFDDAVGWTLLAFVVGIAKSHADPGHAVLIALEAIAYATFLFGLARPFLLRWARSAMRRGKGELGQADFALLLVLLLGSALVTNKIGIFSILGAFMFGAVLASDEEFRDAVLARLGDFVGVFFLPIFFTYTGLRTDVGSMSGLLLWSCCALVVAVGIVGKLGGCSVAARATGLPWRDAGMVGAMMNARGLTALIVVNVGLEAGILTKTAFFMLVTMAVVTTFMTAPLLKRLLAHAPEGSLARAPRDGPGTGGLMAVASPTSAGLTG